MRYVSLWLLGAVLLSLTGPFGTYQEFPYHQKLPYWFGVVSLSSMMGRVSIALCKQWINPRKALLVDFAATGVMCVVFTPVLYTLTHAVLMGGLGDQPSMVQMLFYVLPVSLLVFTVRRLIPGLEDYSYVYATDPTQVPRLVRRLPKHPEDQIIRLSSDDHLVEVVTKNECFRIRMRLADAIEEMNGIEGFLVHRSHWIARNGVEKSERANGRLQVRLINGDEVPVSRTYKPALEEAGLL